MLKTRILKVCSIHSFIQQICINCLPCAHLFYRFRTFSKIDRERDSDDMGMNIDVDIDVYVYIRCVQKLYRNPSRVKNSRKARIGSVILYKGSVKSSPIR